MTTETSTPDPKAQLGNSLIGFLKHNEAVLKSFILSQQPPSKDHVAEPGMSFGGIGTYTPVDPSVPVQSSDVAMFCTRIDRALEYSIDEGKYQDLYGVFTPSPDDASKFLMEAFSIVERGLVKVEPMMDDFYKWEPIRKKMISSRVKVLVALSMVSPAIRDRCDILQRDLQSILLDDERSIKLMMMYVDIIYEATLKHLNTELDRDVFYSVIARRKFSTVERKLRKNLWNYDEAILTNLVSIISTNFKELKNLTASQERSAFESTLRILMTFLNEMHPLVLKNIRMDPQFLQNDVKVYINTLVKAYVPEVRSSDLLTDHFTFLTDVSTCQNKNKKLLPTKFEILTQLFDTPNFNEKQKTVAAFVKSLAPESRSKIQSGLKTLLSRLDGANVPIIRSVRFLVAMMDTPDSSVTDLLDAAMSDVSEVGAFFAPPAWLQNLVKKPSTEAPPKASWWKRNKEQQRVPPEGSTADTVETHPSGPSSPPVESAVGDPSPRPYQPATKSLPTPPETIDHPLTKTSLNPSDNQLLTEAEQENAFNDDQTTRRNAESEYDDLYQTARPASSTADEEGAFLDDQSARQNAESEYDNLYQSAQPASVPDMSKPADDNYLTNFLHDRSAERLRERQAKRKSSQNRDGTRPDDEKSPMHAEDFNLGSSPNVNKPVESDPGITPPPASSLAESEPVVPTATDTIFGDDEMVSSGEPPEALPVVKNEFEVKDEYDPAEEISSLPTDTVSENATSRVDSIIESAPAEPVVENTSSDVSIDRPAAVINDRSETPVIQGPAAEESPASEESKGSVDDLFVDAPETNDNIFEPAADSVGEVSVRSDDVFGGPSVEQGGQVFEEPGKASTIVQEDPIFSEVASNTQESSGLPFETEKANQNSAKTDGIFDGKVKCKPGDPRMFQYTSFRGGDLSSIDIPDVPVEATTTPVYSDRALDNDILIVDSILMTLEYARIYRSPQVLRLISISKGQDVEKASFIGALQRATKKRVTFQFCKDILRMLFVDVTDFVEPDEIDPFEVRTFSEAQSDHTLTYERQLKSLNLTPTGRKIIRADFYFSWMTRALEALQLSSAETDLSLPFLSHFRREVTTRHANLSNYNKTVEALNSFNLQALQTASPAVLSYVKIRSEGQVWNERYKLGFLDSEADKKSLLVEFNNHNFSYYDHSPENAENGLKMIQRYSHIQPVPSGPGKDPPQSWLLQPSDPYQYNMLFGPFTRVFGPKADNKQMAANCNEISDSLLDGKSVFLIGYGASGAGKTSTLICRSGSVECEDPGVVMFILRDKRMWSKYPIIRLSICEMVAAGSGDKGIQKTIWKTEKIIFAFSKDLQSYVSTPKEGSKAADALSDVPSKDEVVTLETVVQHFINVDRRTRGTTNNPSSSRSHVLVFLNLLNTTSKQDATSLVIGDFAGVENSFKCDDLNEIQSIYNSMQCDGDGSCHRVYDESVVSRDRELFATKQCGAGRSTNDLTLDLSDTDNRTIAERVASVYSFIDPATARSSRQKLGVIPEKEDVLKSAAAVISNSEIVKSLLGSFPTPKLNEVIPSSYRLMGLQDIVHDHFLDIPAGSAIKKILSDSRTNVDVIGLCVGIGLVYPEMKEAKSWFPVFQKFWNERQPFQVPPPTLGKQEDHSQTVSNIMQSNPLHRNYSGLFPLSYSFNRHRRSTEYKTHPGTDITYVSVPGETIDNIKDLKDVFDVYGEHFRSLYQNVVLDPFENKNGRVEQLMSAVSVFLWAMLLDAISVREGSLQKLKSAVEICKCRSHEGRYINNALFQMRQAIRDIILVQQNDRGKLRTTPPFLDVCLPINCSPYDTTCMEIDTPPAALAETLTKLSIKADGIVPVILKQIGVEGMRTMKIAVFTLFLMSRKITHDPPSPFIYAEGLRSEYARLSSSVAVNELCDKLLQHRYPPAKLAELKKSLAFYGLGGELEVRQNVVEHLKKDLEDQQQVLGRTAGELYSEIEQMSARHNLQTVKAVLTTIDNVNAVHPIGTLQFADNIAKYNLIDKSCAYSQPFESPMMVQIHSKVAQNMKFTDAMNGLPYTVSAPGDVIVVHDKEIERLEKVEEEEEARREKEEAEEEARRGMEEAKDEVRREREEAEEDARHEKEALEDTKRKKKDELEDAKSERDAAKQHAQRMKAEEALERKREKEERKALKGR